MPAIAPDCPHLPTFDQRPSWANNHGDGRRVDRSACLEVRASELWPRVTLRPCRRRRRRRTTSGDHQGKRWTILEATGSITITAHLVDELHGLRFPRRLEGDARTTKANALRPASMKTVALPGDRAERERQRRHKRVHTPAPAFNPNKGATQTKRLGLWAPGNTSDLPEGWTQTIRIERWKLHEHLTTHFLICPECDGRKKKLFMILCRRDEMRDAEFAEGWIKMLDARYGAARVPLPAPLLAHRAALMDRYGLLFRGRRLTCGQCLALRYGSKYPRQKRTHRKKGGDHQDHHQAGPHGAGRQSGCCGPRSQERP